MGFLANMVVIVSVINPHDPEAEWELQLPLLSIVQILNYILNLPRKRSAFKVLESSTECTAFSHHHNAGQPLRQTF